MTSGLLSFSFECVLEHWSRYSSTSLVASDLVLTGTTTALDPGEASDAESASLPMPAPPLMLCSSPLSLFIIVLSGAAAKMSVNPDRGSDSARGLRVNVAGTMRSSVTITDFLENRLPVVKLYLRSTSQNGYSSVPPPVQIGSVPPFLAATMSFTYPYSS